MAPETPDENQKPVTDPAPSAPEVTEEKEETVVVDSDTPAPEHAAKSAE